MNNATGESRGSGRIRAIVPAAGKGTRLAVDGSDLPKVLHKVAGRTLIDRVLEQLDFIEKKDVYIVVGYKKEEVAASVGEGYNFVTQEKQLGTGNAVAVCAGAFRDFDGTVLVTFGDMPLFRRESMSEMCRRHAESGAACTLMTASDPEITDWARIRRDRSGAFVGIVEGRDCTPEEAAVGELFAGVLVFDSKLLFETLPLLSTDNAQGEYYLTEVPGILASRGYRVDTYMTDDPDDLRGVNRPEDVAVCERIIEKRKRNHRGVSV